MNIEIIPFASGHPDYTLIARSIRQEVFVEEQGVDPALEYEYEEESHHYLLFLDGIPLATARWRETAKGIKLERFAVRKEYRNQGLGADILLAILRDVIPSGELIYLHSQAVAVPFYLGHGFVISSEAFEEAGIQHYLMRYAPK